jgi:hypothetical protein
VALAVAMVALRAAVHSTLTLPTTVDEVVSTLLDTIIEALDQAIGEYRASLAACEGEPDRDPAEYNNLLRIAYNFTTDALQMVSFVGEMCDLKPAVLFLTLHGQLELSNAFKALPWPRARQKASLKLYDSTVKGARNAAFHRLFPFTKAIDVDLRGVPIKATKLRLFSEYEGLRRTRTDALEYEDRELIELLAGFARTAAHSVASTFWHKNVDVMLGMVALLRQFRAALVAILADSDDVAG